MKDNKAEVMDPWAEVNLGTPQNPRVVYVCELLEESLKDEIIKVLQEFKDCFAWSYERNVTP